MSKLGKLSSGMNQSASVIEDRNEDAIESDDNEDSDVEDDNDNDNDDMCWIDNTFIHVFLTI